MNFKRLYSQFVEYKIHLLIFFVSILFLSQFFNKGASFQDDGFYYNSVERVVQGQIVYKDFFYIYPPALLYLLAPLFVLIEKSIIIGRYLLLFVFALSNVIIYLLGKKLMPPFYALIASVLTFIWLFPYHFIDQTQIYSNLMAIFALFFISHYVDDKHKLKMLLFGGAFTGLSFLFKQNVGAYIFVAIIILIILNTNFRASYKDILFYASGCFIVLVPFILFLFYYNLPGLFLNDTFYYIINIYQYSNYSPLPLPTEFFVESKDFFLRGDANWMSYLTYYSPIVSVIFISLIIFDIKGKKKKHILLLYLSLIFLSLQAYPSFGQLSFSLPLSYILGMYFIFYIIDIPIRDVIYSAKSIYNKEFIITLVGCIALITVIVYGFYGILIANDSFKKYDTLLKEPKGQIYLTSYNVNTTEEVLAFIRNNTIEGDRILVGPYAPIFYFLSGRDNVAGWDVLVRGMTEKEQMEVVNEIENKKVKVIIIDSDVLFESHPVIDNYIKSKYYKDRIIRKEQKGKPWLYYTLYKRNGTMPKNYSTLPNI